MEPRWNFFGLNCENGVCRKNHPLFTTCSVSSPRWSRWVAASCCRGVFLQVGQRHWSGVSWATWRTEMLDLNKKWSRALRTSHWAEGSPPNKIVSLNITKTTQGSQRHPGERDWYEPNQTSQWDLKLNVSRHPTWQSSILQTREV